MSAALLIALGIVGLAALALVIERHRIFNEDQPIWHWLGLVNEGIHFDNQEDL